MNAVFYSPNDRIKLKENRVTVRIYCHSAQKDSNKRRGCPENIYADDKTILYAVPFVNFPSQEITKPYKLLKFTPKEITIVLLSFIKFLEGNGKCDFE